jgi:aminoglycoside phosphotransferase
MTAPSWLHECSPPCTACPTYLHRRAPTPNRVSDLAEEVRRWRATADAADPAILRHGAHFAALLAKTLPRADVPPVFVHGDYRLGNIVFDGPLPTGLIDWRSGAVRIPASIWVGSWSSAMPTFPRYRPAVGRPPTIDRLVATGIEKLGSGS